jgi:hypothetical protein
MDSRRSNYYSLDTINPRYRRNISIPNKNREMKPEEIEKIIKHHLKGNYLTSDAGINLLAKDIMNYSQQPTENANKFKQIMEHATAIRNIIAFNEP